MCIMYVCNYVWYVHMYHSMWCTPTYVWYSYHTYFAPGIWLQVAWIYRAWTRGIPPSHHFLFFLGGTEGGLVGANTLTFQTRNNAAACSSLHSGISIYPLLHTNMLIKRNPVTGDGLTRYWKHSSRNAACPFWGQTKSTCEKPFFMCIVHTYRVVES